MNKLASNLLQSLNEITYKYLTSNDVIFIYANLFIQLNTIIHSESLLKKKSEILKSLFQL